MELSKEELAIAQKNNSEFISLKYLDNDGSLKQVDALLKTFQSDQFFICNDSIILRPIKNKNFIDPFRSFSTTSFFCENIGIKNNQRELAKNLISNSEPLEALSISAEISFCLDDELGQNDYSYIADPVDKYSNLRSDIMSTLEDIGIPTISHFHGKTYSESIIGISGTDIIDLIDNIIITNFVITNVVNSYNLVAKFTVFDQLSNITLILKGGKLEIGKISNRISYFTSNNGMYDIKLAKLSKYIKTKEVNILKIQLTYDYLSIPYLAFCELLLYNSQL